MALTCILMVMTAPPSPPGCLNDRLQQKQQQPVRSAALFRVTEGEQWGWGGGGGAGREAACSSDSTSAVLAVGLVITHVISHYCFLVQCQRAAEGRSGGLCVCVCVGGGLLMGMLFDGLGRGGQTVWYVFDMSGPSVCWLCVVSFGCRGVAGLHPCSISHLNLS